MKKHLLATLALLPILAYAKDPNSKAYCENVWKSGNPGIVTISSKHGVTIINKSPLVQTYHITFDNAVQYGKLREMPLDYSEPPFTPNAHMEFDMTVEPGRTVYYGPISIEKGAYFFKKGRYQTKATTVIKVGHIELDKCDHITNVDIT